MATTNGPTSNLILINATQSEEIRVAITAGPHLDNLFIEEMGSHRTGNIYRARITRIVPSLQAAFVDFGSERHGFLPLKEISSHYFRSTANDHSPIAELLSEGQEIIVQVVKEERGNKGAALTTFITLAGSYLVLMPNNPSAGGISRRIEGEDRDQMREYINALTVPEGMGLIIRTAGLGRAQEELEWDLDILLRLWDAINAATVNRQAPFLIHQESDIVIRALRDYLRRDIDEIIIDSPELYEQAKMHISNIRPEFVNQIKLYQDKSIPLFSRYRIEDQIERAFLREVQLPSGGFIVIEETEAMVTIDVNSARDTKGGNIEQTALNTNREAAVESARQLRLRDIGGLIAIDFIDMMSNENQQKIVDIFKEETRNDKARVQFGRISRFGILEVSRQRLRPSLTESSQIVCPRCNGQGSIRSVESLGLLLLRLIRQEALTDNVVAVSVQAPIDVATFMVNEKRHILSEIEAQHHILVRIFPNPHIQTPQYKIERVYDNQVGANGMLPSFKQIEKAEFAAPNIRSSQATNRYSEPAIRTTDLPRKPLASSKRGPGILTRLWSLFANTNEAASTENEKVETPTVEMPDNKPRHRNNRPRSRQHSSQHNSRSVQVRQEPAAAQTEKEPQKEQRPRHPEQQGRRQQQGEGSRQPRPERQERQPRPQHQHQRSAPQAQATTNTAPVIRTEATVHAVPVVTPAVVSTPKVVEVTNNTNAVCASVFPAITPQAPVAPVTADRAEIKPAVVIPVKETPAPVISVSIQAETSVPAPFVPANFAATPSQSTEQGSTAIAENTAANSTDGTEDPEKRQNKNYRNRYRHRNNHYRRNRRNQTKTEETSESAAPRHDED